MAVIGGLESLIGAAIGAIIIEFALELLHLFPAKCRCRISGIIDWGAAQPCGEIGRRGDVDKAFVPFEIDLEIRISEEGRPVAPHGQQH